jgi:hypothetical protein
MDKIDVVVEKIKQIYCQNGRISDSDISKVFVDEAVPMILIEEIMERLDENEVTIESDALSVTEAKKSVDKKLHCEHYIKAMLRINNYKKQQKELRKQSGDDVKKCFLSDFKSSRIQSTYMPLVVISFFELADENGNVELEDMIDYFRCFYEERKKRGIIVERNDSIFVKKNPTHGEIKMLILQNPLGRSCLIKYFIYNKSEDTISLNEKMWDSLTVSEAIKIKKTAKNMIEEYYNKMC